LEADDAAIIAAVSTKQQVIGTIAVHRYDDRIEELKGNYELPSTAEIVKCYVDAAMRRRGIGVDLRQEQQGGLQTIHKTNNGF
jgi:hypothetical protein